jgi:prepilin-type N-terminal cleavage/methylation domain-containing protein
VTRRASSGVTLIEMLIAVTIIGMMAAISYPSVSSGVDTLRLSSASDSLAALLNSAANRAERRQEAVEVTISVKENAVTVLSPDPKYTRRLEIPAGVTIAAVLPKPPGDATDPRRFLLLPGASPPRISVEIANRRGARRRVSVDPRTGVPQVERLPNP